MIVILSWVSLIISVLFFISGNCAIGDPTGQKNRTIIIISALFMIAAIIGFK